MALAEHIRAGTAEPAVADLPPAAATASAAASRAATPHLGNGDGTAPNASQPGRTLPNHKGMRRGMVRLIGALYRVLPVRRGS